MEYESINGNTPIIINGKSVGIGSALFDNEKGCYSNVISVRKNYLELETACEDKYFVPLIDLNPERFRVI